VRFVLSALTGRRSKERVKRTLSLGSAPKGVSVEAQSFVRACTAAFLCCYSDAATMDDGLVEGGTALRRWLGALRRVLERVLGRVGWKIVSLFEILLEWLSTAGSSMPHPRELYATPAGALCHTRQLYEQRPRWPTAEIAAMTYSTHAARSLWLE
jgi:hypothetical protein